MALKHLERILVLIFELVRVEVSGLCRHDMRPKVEHILGDLLVRDVVEIIGFVPYLVGISQRHPEQPLAAGFKGNNVLTRRSSASTWKAIPWKDIPELGGKQIELLKEAVPMVARLAVLNLIQKIA